MSAHITGSQHLKIQTEPSAEPNRVRRLLYAAPGPITPPTAEDLRAHCPDSVTWAVTRAYTMDAAMGLLHHAPQDLIVIDMELDDTRTEPTKAVDDALSSLHRLTTMASDAAVVALIPDGGDALGTARRAFMAGVQDVLTRSEAMQPDVIVRALRNATERRAADQAINQIKRDNDRLYESTPIGIFRSTPQGRYLSVNPALAELYGYDDPEQLIDDVTDIGEQLYVTPGRRADFARMLPFNGRIDDFESEILRRDGTTIWITESARAVHDERGALLYYEGFVRDITQRRRAEQKLRTAHGDMERMVVDRTRQLLEEIAERRFAEDSMRQAKEEAEAATRMKSRFLANMSHELRTPLNAILGFSQIMQMDFGNPNTVTTKPKAHHPEYITNIHTAGEHLLSLINDLLDMAKIDAEQFDLADDPIDLFSLTQDLETMVQPKTAVGCSLTLDVSADLPPLRGDGRRLLQVLVNLVGNAVKFTPADGQVTVQVMRTDSGGIQIRVTDTGIGMDPKDIPQALSEFGQVGEVTQRTQDGTGLGLPLAKRLTELHDGKLDMYSEPGQGTDVVLTFPAQRIVA